MGRAESMIKRSFKRELFVCFVLVAMLPLLISDFSLLGVFKAKLSRDYEKDAMEQMKNIEENIVDFLNRMDMTLASLAGNDTILTGITETDSWLRSKAYKQLYEETQGYRDYAQFNILNAEGQCMFTTSSANQKADLPPYWGILKVAYAHPDDMIIRRAGDGTTSSLQLARAITVDEECQGFVMASLGGEHFESILHSSYDNKNGIAILDRFWEDVYSTKTTRDENLGRTLRQRRMSGEKIKQTTDGISFYIMPIEDSGLYLVMGKDAVFTDDITKTLMGVILSIALLCMLLCLFMTTFMSEYLTTPIKRLTKAMSCVQSGNLDVHVDSKRKDELGQLSADFNKMTGELKSYMELQVRHQQELSDSNIAMMQAQLNPHFLYNTLDTMKWVGKVNHIPEIAVLSSDLAKILRMSISEEKFVRLSEEIRFVNYYMEIQQIRFNGSFSFDVEVPMELEDCIVPKLIIQPIVENAIIHGLKEQEEGHIFLNVYTRQNKLYIEVADNGGGMSEEMVRLLNSRDREALKGHIGFYNVATILRLHYGEEYGVYAEPGNRGGTKVVLILPVDLDKEVPDAEGISG